MLVDTSPGGECSIESTYHVDSPKSTIASRDGIGLRAQWIEPHGRLRRRSRPRMQIHRDRRNRRRGGRRRLTRWRAVRAGHHRRDVSARPFARWCACQNRSRRVQMRARRASGGLLVDSPTRWDHNLGLRAQSRPLRMMPMLRTLATVLCLLGLVATGIAGGSGLGPTVAQARPTPP